MGIFVTALLVANTIASKLIVVGGLVMTAGIIAFPITFAVTDIIGEVWGKQMAMYFVRVGFVTNLIMVALYTAAIKLPAASFWGAQESLVTILGGVPRIVGASMVAYIMSQTWDVYIFHRIRDLTQGRMLWLRNNVGTFTAQALDSAVFLVLAFGGTMPTSALWSMYVSYIIVKWIIALIDTPLVYMGVAWARKEEVE